MPKFSQVPSLAGPLELQINALSAAMTTIEDTLSSNVVGVLLVGSVASGNATHRSDIDLWVILASDLPSFAKVQVWRRALEDKLQAQAKEPLPVQAQFLARSSLDSSEPSIRTAIRLGRIIFDPDGELKQAQGKL